MITAQFPAAFEVGGGSWFLGFPYPKHVVSLPLDWFSFVELNINSFKKGWRSSCTDQGTYYGAHLRRPSFESFHLFEVSQKELFSMVECLVGD